MKPISKIKVDSQPQSSLFGRLLGSIKNSFSLSPTEKSSSLQGRVHENHSDEAVKLCDQFLVVARKLETNVDSELVGHVQAAVELIMRDFRRLQKKVLPNSKEDGQKVYYNWMAKAKRWIDLDAKLHNRIAIVEAVIKQLFADSDDLIDQDLQIISDYETHILADLPLSSEEKAQLEQTLEEHLTPHTQALMKLKEHPPLLEIKNVTQWKDSVDQERSFHFEKALHSIDVLIASLSFSSVEIEEPDELLMSLSGEVDDLHQASSKLLDVCLNEEPINDKTTIKSSLSELQQKVHLLNGNLQLPPELFEKLQSIQISLDNVEALIVTS